MVLPLQKQVFCFFMAAVANFLAVLLYTLTQPLIAKIYTPDSAYTPCGPTAGVYAIYDRMWCL